MFAARKDSRSLSASNGWDDIVSPLSHQVYQKLALQTEVTAGYLRRLGIDAVPSYMRSYLTLMPQIVLDAGMGEVSRMGIILNPFFGCNCKYSAVLTNLELEVDGYVDFGLQEYCGRCTICAEQCPSHAIPRGGPDPVQRLLHLEAQRPRLFRLRDPEQGRYGLRPLYEGLPMEPAGHGAT